MQNDNASEAVALLGFIFNSYRLNLSQFFPAPGLTGNLGTGTHFSDNPVNQDFCDLPEKIGQDMVSSRSGTNLMEHEDYERRRRAELSGSIYSLLFLVIATSTLPWFFSTYMSGLMRRHETGRWTYLLGRYEASLAVIFLVELAIVMCCYRLGPLRMTLREMGVSLKVPRLRELGWGFLSGLFVYAASLPLLFRFERHSGVTELIIRNFYHSGIALIIVLYAVLLPIASEIVHRGIIFKAFLESSSLASAVLLNAVVFALVWPVHNWIIGSLLGVVTAVLYYRFRDVASPIVANVVLTLGCAATLVWRDLCNLG